jgi:tetratricopeptide (TPR) repeat protein
MRAPGGQIAFGPFCIDNEGLRLLRDGIEVELRPQALHALRTLVQSSGRCVPYEEMISEAWHGISVSRHTVAVTVGEVKKALREYGAWIGYHPKLGYRLEVPKSEDLIRNGWHYWRRHTREGFEKALACFERAAQDSNTDFRAFEGISRCYLMLGTFAMRSPREMYANFLDAHSHAVALCGLTPELRADRAQGLHVFERRLAEAEAELLQARKENRWTAGVHIRLAVLYATSKRFDEALEILNEAYEVDGLWPILPAAEILIRCCRGEFEEAVACGKKALDLHPYFALGRSHYGQALELAGRFDEALEQYRMACMMAPDLARLRAEEAACLARCGRTDEAAAILRELHERSQTEYIDSYHFAIILDALGMREEALLRLENAAAENSPSLFLLEVDPRLNGLRNSPRFKRLRNQLFPCENPLGLPELSNGALAISTYKAKDSSPSHRVAS